MNQPPINPSRPEKHQQHVLADDEATRRQAAAANQAKMSKARLDRFKPPVIRTLDDIKRAIRSLGTGVPGAYVNTTIDVLDETDKVRQVAVTGTTPGKTKLDMLRDGLAIFRDRKALASAIVSIIPINKRNMKAAAIMGDPTTAWVDSLLKRWLGATRDGHLISWQLGDATYYLDVFDMQLYAGTQIVGKAA